MEINKDFLTNDIAIYDWERYGPRPVKGSEWSACYLSALKKLSHFETSE